MRGTRPSPGQLAMARALRREGLSLRAVAARMGLPRSTVAGWLVGQGEPAMVMTCWCGERFIARRSDARFCSDAHRQKYHYAIRPRHG